MIPKDQCEFLLRLTKDEVTAQSAAFDQIDNKTGVALGFTFVAVGQVLAAVFRMATDQNHFQTPHPYWVTGVFILANICVALAITFGVCSRWPRSFQHAIEWTEEEYSLEHVELLNITFRLLQKITVSNDETITKKSYWAKGTYIFVALALACYLGLTALLYSFSIPKTLISPQTPLQPEARAIETQRNVKPAASTSDSPCGLVRPH